MEEFLATVWGQVAVIGSAVAVVGGMVFTGYRWGFNRSPTKQKLDEIESEKTELSEERDLAVKQQQEARGEAAKLASENRKYHSLKEALLSGDKALWNSHQSLPYDGYDDDIRSNDLHVISIMNLKGGVGKTTIASNLAAYFDLHKKKRVLVIDLDYQGSATTVLLNLMGYQTLPGQHVSKIFSNLEEDIKPFEFAFEARQPLSRTDLLPCSYPFLQVENKEMVRWLFQESRFDPRYRLAQALYSKNIREEYDVVIIDAPPRLSLGAINALSSCRTLIIPTSPDPMSTEAVGNFGEVLGALAGVLNPALSRLLLAVNMTKGTEINDAEERNIAASFKKLDHWPGIIRRIPRTLPNRAVFANAALEQSLAWLKNDAAQKPILDILTEFGDFIAHEVGIR